MTEASSLFAALEAVRRSNAAHVYNLGALEQAFDAEMVRLL